MKRLLCVVIGALTIVACGPGVVQTSIPATSKVSELSAEQTKQLCADRMKYFDKAFTPDEQKTFGCSLGSIIAGALGGALGGGDVVASCNMAFTTCQAKPAGMASDTCSSVVPDPKCAASVADFNVCFTEQIEALRKFSRGNQCSLLSGGTDGGLPIQTSSSTCDKIAPSCERAKMYSW